MAASASRPADGSCFCWSARRRWRRRCQVLQIQDGADRGAARPGGVDHATEYWARVVARSVRNNRRNDGPCRTIRGRAAALLRRFAVSSMTVESFRGRRTRRLSAEGGDRAQGQPRRCTVRSCACGTTNSARSLAPSIKKRPRCWRCAVASLLYPRRDGAACVDHPIHVDLAHARDCRRVVAVQRRRYRYTGIV